MIYIENIFHVSLMENRDGILTEEGEKNLKKTKSDTHTLCESMEHSFQNKKIIEQKINLMICLPFLFFFLPTEAREKQNLAYCPQKQCMHILVHLTDQIVFKNL